MLCTRFGNYKAPLRYKKSPGPTHITLDSQCGRLPSRLTPPSPRPMQTRCGLHWAAIHVWPCSGCALPLACFSSLFRGHVQRAGLLWHHTPSSRGVAASWKGPQEVINVTGARRQKVRVAELQGTGPLSSLDREAQLQSLAILDYICIGGF